MRQYFWESDSDELPYSRIQRSLVYQRSKEVSSVRPFGSQRDMYDEDYEWLNHSIAPTQLDNQDFRIKVAILDLRDYNYAEKNSPTHWKSKLVLRLRRHDKENPEPLL